MSTWGGARDRAPDYVGRVAGVRIWRVAPNLWAQLGGLLWAPAMKEPGPTGEEYYAAWGSHPDRPPAAAGCTCGVYAFYDSVLAAAGGYWPDPLDELYPRLLAGVIGAAGEIDLAEHGFRAGRATVEAFFTAGAPDHELPIPRAEIAASYDAEVIAADDYRDFCEERGLLLF
jgi:hypothetical protein